MLSVSLIHDIINVQFAWVGTGYRRPQARVGHYFKWVGQSPEWVGHGLPGLGLEPPLKAALVFQRLNRIWSSHSINSTIKLRLYASIVLSTALHACETWTSTARIRNTLDVFHRRCIWKILGLSWQDLVTNMELMRRSGMRALSEIVQTRRLRLAGHVLRLPDVFCWHGARRAANDRHRWRNLVAQCPVRDKRN